MSTYKKKEFELSNAGIDAAAEFLAEQLEALALPRKDVLRLRLSVEEILLKWQESGQLAQTFTLALTKRLRRVGLTLTCAGLPVDPVAGEEDENYGGNLLGRSMLENLGLSPTWQYRDGVNTVTAVQKVGKRMSQLAQVAIAAALAAVLGVLGTFVPAAWTDFLLDSLIDPIFNAFLGALSCIVGPMMFLSIMWGMFNIGDTRQLGTIGRKLLARFLLASFLVGAVCVAAALLVFRIPVGSGEGGQGVFKSLIEMVLGIIPTNIVEPFANGNTLQILFMGIVVGVVMILLRDRMQIMSSVVEQSNAIVQVILSAIGALVPGFIFLSVLRLILQGTLSQNAAGLMAVILLSIGVMLLDMLVQTLLLTRLGLSPIQTVKKFSSFSLVGLSTASSAAAYPAMLDCCENKLGVDSKLANFALPFGSVVFKSAVVNLFILVPLFAAHTYGVELNTGSLILCLLNAVILSIAAPPIPGGCLSCFTLMFMQLGVPLEGLSLAVAAYVVLDFTATVGNLYDLVAQLAHGAKSLGMLDGDILHRP